MLSVNVDLKGMRLDDIADAIKEFPVTGNPLLEWKKAYGLRTLQAPRPNVGSSGTFRGNVWPKLEPQYTRKTDGVVVPVWGGVKRVRAGRVTQVRAGGRTRRASTLSKSQKASGFGVVKLGQTFDKGNVLGKLRSTGQRYKQGDEQLRSDQPTSILKDWATGKPVLSDRGKRIKLVSNHPGARRNHDLRPFSWGKQIEQEELRDITQRVNAYIQLVIA